MMCGRTVGSMNGLVEYRAQQRNQRGELSTDREGDGAEF